MKPFLKRRHLHIETFWRYSVCTSLVGFQWDVLWQPIANINNSTLVEPPTVFFRKIFYLFKFHLKERVWGEDELLTDIRRQFTKRQELASIVLSSHPS